MRGRKGLAQGCAPTSQPRPRPLLPLVPLLFLATAAGLLSFGGVQRGKGLLGRNQKFRPSQRRRWQDHEPFLYWKHPANVQKELDEKGYVSEENVPQELIDNREEAKKYDIRRRRKGAKKERRKRFGDAEAAKLEFEQALKALNESNYDRAVMHYRIAVLQDPLTMKYWAGLLKSMRLLPERNYTMEVEQGSNAIGLYPWTKKNMDTHSMVSIFESYARSVCDRIHHERNGECSYKSLNGLRKLNQELGLDLEHLDKFKIKAVDLSRAHTRKVRREKGEVVDSEDPDEQDEDEVELAWERYGKGMEYEGSANLEERRRRSFALDKDNLLRPIGTGKFPPLIPG